ncbi:MAG TPA: GNAT family N-acetyltransferase [Alphaproteobacteria bacterium]
MGITYDLSVTLRPATTADLDFVWRVYAEGIGPYLSAYQSWKTVEQKPRFARIYDPRHSAIVLCEGADAGFLTTVGYENTIVLQQFFIAEEFRSQGLGSTLLGRLREEWDEMAQPVSLAVLKNNPAQRLYRRFGFSVYWQNDSRLFMVRRPRG